MRRRRRATERGAAALAAGLLPIAACLFAAPVASQQVAERPTAGAAADETPDLSVVESPKGAEALEAFLDTVTTLSADFEQEVVAADGEIVDTAAGTLALSRPDRFRWRYTDPYEQVIVADGENLWVYDVELEQVTVTPLDEVAATPAMLLSGDRSVREGFTVVESFTFDGLEWVQLAPDIEGTDFESVLLGFSGSTPRRLELVDSLSQVTRIDLDNVVVNPDLDEDLFEFEPPRGVAVSGTPR